VKLFFASDVHGSERCFLKFINAGRYYGADVLVLGGDITGKALVPIVRGPNGNYRADFLGDVVTATTAAELGELERLIRFNGHYPLVMGPDELAKLRASPEAQVAAFRRVMRETLARWLELAAERLDGRGTRCLVMPGNDDDPDIDDIIASSPAVENPHDRVVDLGDGLVLAGSAYSNTTPWRAPRELPEADLAAHLEALCARVGDFRRAVLCTHVPPHESGLDSAPAVDSGLNLRASAGQPCLIAAGSRAVRAVIEARQPLLALHGHIHEARGFCRLGRTLCINPGSDYAAGILRGAWVTIEGGRVCGFQLVAG
jgi:Icc-related predicted phosphoesterase